MCLLVAFLLLAFGAAEIYVIYLVGGEAGWFNTVLLLIVSAFAGIHYARRQGMEAMRRMQASMGRGETPAESMLNSLAIMAGGALLVAPGFISDAIGLTMLFPPTRALWKMVFVYWIAKKLAVVRVNAYGAGYPPNYPPREPPPDERRTIDV